MTPWWVHNYKKYDHFVRLSLGDGIAFYVGNNIDENFNNGIDFGQEVKFMTFQIKL